MHHPRWASWSNYGNEGARVAPFLTLLRAVGTDVVLTGHAHQYERLVQVNAAGVADPTNGFTQFTVGTGGVSLRDPVAGETLSTSAYRRNDEYGVPALALEGRTYRWRFVSTSGAILDSGTDSCVN